MVEANWSAVMTHEKDTKDADRLRDVVQQIINNRKAEERLSPSRIATEALVNLDAGELQKTKPLVYLPANLQLPQLPPHACRKQCHAADQPAINPPHHPT